MANSYTLTALDRFPAGTAVGAYPATGYLQSQLPPSGAPPVAASETQTMGATGATFTTLADGTYYFGASISGTWRFVSGKVSGASAAPVLGGETISDIDVAPGADIASSKLHDGANIPSAGQKAALAGALPPSATARYQSVLFPTGGDDSAALQAFLDTSPFAVGLVDITLAPGTFLWNTAAVKLPRSAVGIRIRGSGIGVTTIKLSTNAPRAFDLNRIADYDTFQNIEISDLGVDCDNIVAGTSNQHVLFGNLISGGGLVAQRVNVKDIVIRRCRTINVPTPATGVGNRQNVAIYSRHLAGGETQTQLQDILIEDCDFQGGNVGVAVVGSNATGGAVSEVRIDRIRLNRVKWNSGKTPDGGNTSSAGAQIGSLGFGGSCHIKDCSFTGSDDEGIEIDGMTYSLVENTVCQDSYNDGFFVRNFHAPENPNAQIARFRGCDSRVSATFNPAAGHGRGFSAGGSSAPTSTFGQMILDNCTFYSAQTTAPASTGQALLVNDQAVSGLTTRNFRVVFDALSYTNASGTARPTPIIYGTTVNSVLEMHNTHVKLAGAVTVSGGSVLLRPAYITAASSSKVRFTIDGFFLDQGITGVSNSGRYLALGEETGTMSGTVSRFKVISHTGGDTTPRYIWLGAAATLTVDDGIVIKDCDFLQGPSGQTEVFFNGTTENRDKVVLRSNAYKSSTALDFASAATLIVPDSDQMLNITGATTITSINALRNGAVLPLRFAGALTLTDGSNLKLDGDFLTAAGSTVLLASDGTNFLELARSTN